MKAAQISEYGETTVVQINEIDKPIPTAGQVLVEVHASSLNPFDSAVRSGYMKDIIPLDLPATLGGDIAGVVTEVSDGVAGMEAGNKVYGQAAVVAGNSGALAEYAATARGQLALAPKNLSFEEAASLPLVGASALQALQQHIGLKAGQRLFINGGSGGIGTIAIQVAKHLGAEVTTTATGDGLERVKALGADAVIDYKVEDFSSLRDFDAVFDTVGGDDFTKSLHILKPGGVAVSMAAQADAAVATKLGVTAISQNTKITTEVLNELTRLVEAEVVTPQVDHIFPLAQIAEAFEARENHSILGKVVIAIR